MNILFKTIVSFLKDAEYRNLLFTTLVILGIGTIFYHFVEKWSWIDSVYFCVVTLTTIGYGDFAPKSDLGKIFTIGYILLGIGIILSFVNTVYLHYAHTNRKSKQNPT